tara:strand:+ start:476 stop:649 length:174 start_codon:yes stop_codon:yes gene_type:complete
MDQTTLSKTDKMAENLIASIMLNAYLKEVEHMAILQRLEELDQIATLILMSQTPAEA